MADDLTPDIDVSQPVVPVAPPDAVVGSVSNFDFRDHRLSKLRVTGSNPVGVAMTYPEGRAGDVLQHATQIPLTFQRFPITPANSMQHTRNTRDLFCCPRSADFQDASVTL
jgi:hypothetical protein